MHAVKAIFISVWELFHKIIYTNEFKDLFVRSFIYKILSLVINKSFYSSVIMLWTVWILFAFIEQFSCVLVSLELRFRFSACSIRSDVLKRFLSLRECSNYIKSGYSSCSKFFSCSWVYVLSSSYMISDPLLSSPKTFLSILYKIILKQLLILLRYYWSCFDCK